MAPEVIACDENPDATYDNRVRNQKMPLNKKYFTLIRNQFSWITEAKAQKCLKICNINFRVICGR